MKMETHSQDLNNACIRTAFESSLKKKDLFSLEGILRKKDGREEAFFAVGLRKDEE